jgi:hypothetical protein
MVEGVEGPGTDAAHAATLSREATVVQSVFIEAGTLVDPWRLAPELGIPRTWRSFRTSTATDTRTP